MRLRASKNTITLLAAALGLGVLATGGLFWVGQGALGRTLAVLHTKESELNDGQRVARRRDRAEQDLAADRRQLSSLESGVTDAEYIPTMLKQLEELATSTHNRVLGVRPQLSTEGPSKIQQRRDPEAQAKAEGNGGGDGKGDGKKKDLPKPYTELSIMVNLVGGFQSAQSFVDRLNRFPKIVAVESVQIHPHRASAAETNGVNSLLDVDVKVTAYVMKDALPAARQSADQTVTTASAAVQGSVP
jgi:hypothetical protein